jgi:hypothetical protein
MKKSLGIVAALSLVWSAQPAQAELLKNLRIGGQIDLQATSAHNVLDFVSFRNEAPAPTGAAIDNNNDRIGDLQTRVMLNLDWDLLDDVHARVTLRKNDRTWGTANGTLGAAGSQVLGSQAGANNNLLGAVYLDEANFKIDKIAGFLDLTLGRQFYGAPGDLVIYFGPSDKARYGMPVEPVDIARADWSNEWMGVTGIAGKTTGHALGAAATTLAGSAGDVDVRGLNVMLKGTENYSGSLYGYNRYTHNNAASGLPPSNGGPGAGGKPDSLYVVGLKFKLSGAGFWWRGEAAQNFGENRIDPVTTSTSPASNYIGSAFLTNAGWKYESESSGMLAFWGEFGLGTGRANTRSKSNEGFQSINSDYRPGSMYGRFVPSVMSAVALGGGVPLDATGGVASEGLIAKAGAQAQAGLNNRIIYGGGVRMSPGFANKLVIGASYWDFWLHRITNSPDPALGVDGSRTALQGNRHIGSEIDVDLVWTHSENVAFAAGWATFQPGGSIKEAIRLASVANNRPAGGIGVSPATMVYFDTRVKF